MQQFQKFSVGLQKYHNIFKACLIIFQTFWTSFQQLLVSWHFEAYMLWNKLTFGCYLVETGHELTMVRFTVIVFYGLHGRKKEQIFEIRKL